jgi:hypothetical protein
MSTIKGATEGEEFVDARRNVDFLPGQQHFAVMQNPGDIELQYRSVVCHPLFRVRHDGAIVW